MFCQFNNKIINLNSIKRIECDSFLDKGQILVYYDNTSEFVFGAEALQLIMDLYPSVLEGKRGKYWKNQWVVHNLIGHPLMQIFSWLYLPKLAIWIHEKTIPKPLISSK